MLDEKEGLSDFWMAGSGQVLVTAGAAIGGTAICSVVLQSAVVAGPAASGLLRKLLPNKADDTASADSLEPFTCKSKSESEGDMLLTYRLVRLIETHSDALAAGLLARVRSSPRLSGYSQVPPEELQQRVYEIYHHLGEWLLGKREIELERRYREVGGRRAAQGVPLSELMWAIILTKENLWEFVNRESGMDRPPEVFSHLELLELLEGFFDRAIHYAAVGHEEWRRTGPVAEMSVAG